METISNKKLIINNFKKNVKNKIINLDSFNKKHCGKEGHWLEKNNYKNLQFL